MALHESAEMYLETIHVLLKKNGHLPIVNTGRPIGHVDPRVQKLDFSGWICSCGMELILDGEMIYKDYPTEEECRYILDLAHRCRMAIQTEGLPEYTVAAYDLVDRWYTAGEISLWERGRLYSEIGQFLWRKL